MPWPHPDAIAKPLVLDVHLLAPRTALPAFTPAALVATSGLGVMAGLDVAA
jgi:hypothetical protein